LEDIAMNRSNYYWDLARIYRIRDEHVWVRWYKRDTWLDAPAIADTVRRLVKEVPDTLIVMLRLDDVE
jgi:hypothetical protein